MTTKEESKEVKCLMLEQQMRTFDDGSIEHARFSRVFLGMGCEGQLD